MVQVEAHLVQDCIVPGFVYGVGPTMIGLNAMLSEISRTNIPVLLVGESGTGKDAYARLIHRLPQESDRNFFRINCAATDPADLLAQLQKVMSGKAHSESSRTIYLDNIQELDSACQRVLTSQLPEQEIIVSTDAIVPRFISSSTRNLEAEVETARFRRDLYFRLNGACLRLPPLCERAEDIPIFLEHFLDRNCSELKKKVSPLNKKTIQTLEEYHWPGNIRELEHFAQKIVVFGDAQLALNDLLSSRIINNVPMLSGAGGSLKVAARAASKQAERQLILQALERTHWNRKRAAQELQISYKSLLYKIKQIGALNEDHRR